MQREEEEKRRVREQAERERRESLLKERRHKAAVSIQKVVRGFLSRHKFLMVYLSTLRAREEHSRDDEQQKYRLYEANRHRKMCVLEARRDGQHGPTNTHRRELLRERRERTMRLLEEKRLLHASKLEKEVAQEKAQRAKERVQRRKQMLEMWKGTKTSQKESMDLSGASQIVEKRFFGEMIRKLQGHAKDSNESPTEFSQNVGGDSRYQDSTFDIVKKQWEEKERWKDERERILGPRHEAHGSALTPRQRHLEGQYRIRTVSNVLWQLESKAAALSFQKQQR
ncbi:myosin heavy chain MYA2-related [Trypanosoma cruzi]|nr:myosin heavy chain MYA2-related [Trypanosoma cruzi]